MRVVTLFAICMALFMMGITAFAAIPPMVSYQGKLTKADGTLLPDGTYTMRFAIYTVPTAGDIIWSETNPAVQVKKGLFSVLLGSVVNLPGNIFDSTDRYFGVKVGEDAEMSPRQQIASVPFAFRAGSAGNADNAATAGIADTVKDGAITKAKIEDGSITIEKISVSAIKLGYAQSTTVQYLSAETDLTNLTVTVDVPIGRMIKITAFGLFDSAGIGNKSHLFIYEGDTQLQVACIYNSTACAAGSGQTVMCQRILSPTPGIHTYKLRASATISSALCAVSSSPAFILVEAL